MKLMFASLIALTATACNSAAGSIVDQPCAKDVCGCFPTECGDGTCCKKDESCDEAGGVKGCGWVGPPVPDENGNFGAPFSWHVRGHSK